MDVSLEKTSLLKIVQPVQGALSNKSTLPILNGILLEAKNNSLVACSTDLEVSIKSEGRADVKKMGKVVVFGSLLIDLVKSLDDGKANLSLNEKENKLLVKSGNSTFVLNTLPTEDYPSLPVPEGTTTINIKSDDLVGAIRQVAVATSRDESRPILTGVYFHPDKNNIRFVATDSYRLSFRELKTPKNTHTTTAVIPRRVLEEIVKIVPKEETVKVGLTDKQVSFEGKSLLFVSRTIGGQYPNFDQLFPKKFTTTITADKEMLLQAAKRMATLSSATPLILRLKNKCLTIISRGSDVGSGEETIPAEGGSKEVEIAFNSRYLIDGLNTINDKEVILQLTDAQQPGLLRGASSPEFSYLIMPVRLN